jgi:glucosamine 6-phosphate synthetase-like amidotransferase/phosphosugar isomerase protein
MCGFIGVVGKMKAFDIANSLEKIKHRGPDSFGIKTGAD